VIGMTERDQLENLSMKVFADRFQTEKIGLVYHSQGLGRGGQTVTFAEANDYLDRYADMLVRNRRHLKLAAYVMFAGLLTGFVAAYFWMLKTAIAVMGISVGLFFAAWGTSLISPSLLDRQIRRELQRRITSAPLPRSERLRLGFAWPYWKILVCYGIGGPLLLFLVLHRAGPHGLVSLLGPELAQQYHVALTVFVSCLLLVTLLLLPYIWFKQHNRQRDPNK